MKHTIIFFASCVVFVLSNACAQENAVKPRVNVARTVRANENVPSKQEAIKQVTIAELQEIALKNHTAYKIAEAQIDAEHGARLQAGLRPNPTTRYEAEEVGASGKAGKQGVVVEQELGGETRRRLLVQSHSQAIEKLNWNREIVVAKIKNDVRIAAYRVLIAQKKVDLNKRLLEIAQASEARANQAMLSGAVEISKLNFIQLQNQTRQTKLSLTEELNAQKAAETKLNVLLGDSSVSSGVVADDPEALGDQETFDENATLDELLERSPEIARIRAEIEEKKAALDYERAPKREFSIEGGVLYDFGDRRTLAQAGVGIPFGINDRNQGNVQRATAEFFIAQRELERAKLKLRADFAEIYADYRSAREEAVSYKKEILPDLENYFTMSRQAYDQGEIGFLELNLARSSYIEAQVDYLEALERLAESIVKIEGAMLEHSLETE